MIRGPTGCRPQSSSRPNREHRQTRRSHEQEIALINEIIETLGQERPLPTIRLLNEKRLIYSPKNHGRIIAAVPRFHTARVACGSRASAREQWPASRSERGTVPVQARCESERGKRCSK
jgi:hypothetical protein